MWSIKGHNLANMQYGHGQVLDSNSRRAHSHHWTQLVSLSGLKCKSVICVYFKLMQHSYFGQVVKTSLCDGLTSHFELGLNDICHSDRTIPWITIFFVCPDLWTCGPSVSGKFSCVHEFENSVGTPNCLSIDKKVPACAKSQLPGIYQKDKGLLKRACWSRKTEQLIKVCHVTNTAFLLDISGSLISNQNDCHWNTR